MVGAKPLLHFCQIIAFAPHPNRREGQAGLLQPANGRFADGQGGAKLLAGQLGVVHLPSTLAMNSRASRSALLAATIARVWALLSSVLSLKFSRAFS